MTPGRMFGRIYRGAGWLARWVAYAGVAGLLAAGALTVVDILIRRTTGTAVAGLVDITQLFVMACVFLALPHLFMREANVTVDFVTDRLRPRALAALKALIALLGALFIGACGGYSAAQAALQIENGDISQTIGIPIVWYWAPLLAGCAFAALVCLLLAARYAAVAAGAEDVTARA